MMPLNTTNANAALKKLKEEVGCNAFDKLIDQPQASLLRDVVVRELGISDDLKTALRNNLGGYVNHDLFWGWMRSPGGGRRDRPEGLLATAIVDSFKSFDDMKAQFNAAALKVFGSGWAWLVFTKGEQREWELKITTTPNQDHPLIRDPNAKPILALDVWEHAYYLKYQNKRAEYINNWWNIVNWERVEELFHEAIQCVKSPKGKLVGEVLSTLSE